MSTEGGTLYGQWERIAVSFKDDTWDVIAKAVRSNDYPYKVGDTKTITLDGFGDHTVRVANISECTNGETSETACGFVVEFADIITTHYMNSTDTNVGGYPASSMYSYLKNTILPAIPEEIRNVMINTKIVSSHGPYESENFLSYSTLYLLSRVEINGSRDPNWDSASQVSKQLDLYFTIGLNVSFYPNAIKNYNGSPTYWWTRSSRLQDSGFVCWQDDGAGCWKSIHTGTAALGVSPAFRIG